jgi:hypothetical protein
LRIEGLSKWRAARRVEDRGQLTVLGQLNVLRAKSAAFSKIPVEASELKGSD